MKSQQPPNLNYFLPVIVLKNKIKSGMHGAQTGFSGQLKHIKTFDSIKKKKTHTFRQSRYHLKTGGSGTAITNKGYY